MNYNLAQEKNPKKNFWTTMGPKDTHMSLLLANGRRIEHVPQLSGENPLFLLLHSSSFSFLVDVVIASLSP